MDFLSKTKWILYIVLGIFTLLTGIFMFYSIVKYSQAKKDQTMKPDMIRYIGRTMILFIFLFLINLGALISVIYTINVSIPRSIEKGVESILKALQTLQTVSQIPQK